MFRNRQCQATFFGILALAGVLSAVVPVHLRAQDDDAKWERYGRKYKPPPPTSHIEVTVVKQFNQKPIDGAHVIFHPVLDGKDEGNMELKTHQDGKTSIDVIPTGSTVTIQVLADGFATYAKDYEIKEASRKITIQMIRPRAQVSTYVDNQGKPSQMKPGIQEPIRPKAQGSSGTAPSDNSSTSSSGSGNSPQSH